MNYIRLCSTLIHSLSSSLGVAFNMLLIFLVLKKTTKQLRTYSILIFNFALCEFCTCLADLLAQLRATLLCPCAMEFAILILVSFLCQKRTPPSKRIIVASILVMYIPSFLQLMTFSFANDNEDELKRIVEKKYGYDMHSEYVGGFKNTLGWRSLPGVLHITLPVAPVYIAILVLRKLTISILSRGMVMSESNRRLHSQLLQALTIQACLPIFFLLAVIVYAIEQLNICHHPLLEYSCFMLVSFIPMLSPLTSFVFIRPYNVWIKETFLRRTKVSSSTRVSTVTSTARISDQNIKL
ncbi:unnamed protein product [Haemonchus placei]|uniref:G protein-coupled receptor n=1 Tax=Haemonchus placei TaxID=6290 RepID=A0A0N4WJK9_HAEPC|nr:unnamed protein product [Haemonchus placei]